ncbi:DNA-binding protein [Burkholderia sp. MS455]|uniref:DNA-binding protein n=1 Tax=Burkholderia sp. MS455 TaxID=2811788 RepID=UPI001EF5667C|nr:DNA-binding protein [Burkholderia sp. MS455]
MLAEAGDAAPLTGARFRQLVSVRKARTRLGAGDPATLARALNAIEAEVVRAGLVEIAMPGMPPDNAEQMRALWQEVTELRSALTGRDAELADLRAQHTLIRDWYAALDATLQAGRPTSRPPRPNGRRLSERTQKDSPRRSSGTRRYRNNCCRKLPTSARL